MWKVHNKSLSSQQFLLPAPYQLGAPEWSCFLSKLMCLCQFLIKMELTIFLVGSDGGIL